MNCICKTRTVKPLILTTLAAATFALHGTTETASAAGRAPRSTSHGSGSSTGSSSTSSNSTGSNSTGSTSSRSKSGTAVRKPAATPSDRQTIEQSKGSKLTDEQNVKIKAAGDTLNVAMKAADGAFLSQVAAAVGLSVGTLKAKIQAIAPNRLHGISSNIESLLPQILERALTDTERAAIVKAIGTWNDAVKVANDAYKAAVDDVLGTSSGQGEGKGCGKKGGKAGGKGGDKGKGGGKGQGGCGGGSTAGGGPYIPGTTTGSTDTGSTDTTTYQSTTYSRRR